MMLLANHPTMKHTVTKLLSLVIFLWMMAGCGGDDSGRPNGSGEISFRPQFANEMGNGRTLDLSDAVSILITVNHNDGSPTEYSTSEIALYQLNGEFISQKISLPVGAYRLTEFLVLDEDNNIIYVAPEEGSLQAQNVSDPLPIEFVISVDDILDLEVEVLSTDNLGLEDFGLVGFDLSKVDLFRFYVNVSEKGKLEELLSAELVVNAESYSFHQNLAPIANNSVVIKEGFLSYTILVTKDGYHDYSITLSREELNHYESTPLTVELELDLWLPGEDYVDPRDGEVYKTVQIGDQVWMAENLRAITFNDGVAINNVTDDTSWESLTTAAYSWYDNNEESNKTPHGALYNWYTVESGKLCPVGWRVPADDDWLALRSYVGSELAGRKLKDDGTDYWGADNNGTNETGFAAVPSGSRENGVFGDFGQYAYFWSTWSDHPTTRHRWELRKTQSIFPGPFNISRDDGYSVRCMLD
tara:strand:+ start:1696 stop:3108 length:1413 start_codon:yes stop_codon:yes gene_type:complete